jgi:hypothetical protein
MLVIFLHFCNIFYYKIFNMYVFYRLEQKVCNELSRCVQELKNLLETQNQILKGQVPDINLILGSELDEAAKVSHLKPQVRIDKRCPTVLNK